MVDFFKTAFNFLSGDGAPNNGGNAFVGQTIDIGDDMKLKIKRVIAEGGYGFVFEAKDSNTGIDYALKRQIVPSDEVKIMKQEITFLQQLKGHPHIINFVTAASTEKAGAAEFLILTELITGGELVDIVNTQRLTPNQVLRVFHETCLAVAHMHSQAPPIIHRDLKVENLLLTDRGSIKLCDLGSATTKKYNPDHTWTASQRGLTEDEIQKNTTPMYRAPEMIDLYSNNPINEKADIWALGCLLYKLCYQEHPFEDSAKLRILNANYHIPPNDTVYKDFHQLIKSCLVVDPDARPSVDGIIAQLYSIADKLGENFDRPSKQPLISPPRQQTQPETQTRVVPPSQSQSETTSSSSSSSTFQSTSQQAQKFFGFMKGGAENIIKNIKDTSSKVINSVQYSQQNKYLDITYITSRLMVMSFPYEQGGANHPNALSEVAAYLEETHSSQYLVFNLSGEQYDTDRLNGQVVDYEWPHKSIPSLESLVELCRQMDSWLRADPHNVLVIHCKDGIHPSGVLIVAYLLFLRALTSPGAAVRMFGVRRLPEGQSMEISGTENRYLNYVANLVRPHSFKPHPHSFAFRMLKLTSIPLYNERKDGCTPFVEVYIEGERVYTSCTKENMDKIRPFKMGDKCVSVPMDVTIQGNVQIIVHHIRSIPTMGGAKNPGMGMSGVKMFSFQFHTGFISSQANSMTFERAELDGPATKRQDKFPSPFKVVMDISLVPSTDDSSSSVAWQNLPHPVATPITCFSTEQEQKETSELFGGYTDDFESKPPPPVPTQVVAPPIPLGYGQLIDDDILIDTGDKQPQAEHSLGDFIEHHHHRGNDQGAESSTSDSSTSDSSSENEQDNSVLWSSTGRPMASQHSSDVQQLEDFFSNPNIEEANLLEFSVEEDSQSTTNTTSMFSTNTISTTVSGNKDPFTNWNWQSTNVGVAPTPTTSSSANFDPFAPNKDEDTFDLLGATDIPLVPSAGQTSSNTSQTSGWPSFTSFPSTSSSSSNNFSANFTSSNISTGYSNISTGRSNISTGSGNFTTGSGNFTTGGNNFTTGRSNFTTGGSNNKIPSSTTRPQDPFGDIWNQATTSTTSNTSVPNAATANSQTTSSFGSRTASYPNIGNAQRQPIMTNRPTYQMQYGAGVQVGGSRPKSGGSGGLGVPSTSNTQRARSPSPIHTTTNKFGPVPPNLRKNQFDDLLDPGLFSSKKEDEGPVSLKGMKKKDDIGKIMDPDRARVAEWAEGKEHNIRALLSSLHTILWEGETRWKPIGMHQLVEPDQVSKFFRRACLSVHPDKAQETSHENLARAIFDELNEAYELFEISGAKSLYQT